MRVPVTSTGAALFFLAVAAPLLWREHALAAWAITQFFSFACHQDPARSLWIAGAPVAVCARCLGTYFGAAAGAWIRLSHARALRFLAIAAVVNALDVLAGIAGLHGNWLGIRFALGAGLGAATACLLVSAVPTAKPFPISES